MLCRKAVIWTTVSVSVSKVKRKCYAVFFRLIQRSVLLSLPEKERELDTPWSHLVENSEVEVGYHHPGPSLVSSGKLVFQQGIKQNVSAAPVLRLTDSTGNGHQRRQTPKVCFAFANWHPWSAERTEVASDLELKLIESPGIWMDCPRPKWFSVGKCVFQSAASSTTASHPPVNLSLEQGTHPEHEQWNTAAPIFKQELQQPKARDPNS